MDTCPGNEPVERRGTAAVGDVNDADPRHAAEQLAREMAGAAVTRGRVIHLAEPRAQPTDQLRQGLCGKRGIRHQHERHRGERCHSHEIAHRVVAHPVEIVRDDDHGRVARKQQGVPVGRRAGDRERAAGGDGPGMALQHRPVQAACLDTLSRDPRQNLGDGRRCVLGDGAVGAREPRGAADVGRAADRVGDDDPDRTRRKRFRLRGAGASHRHCRQGDREQESGHGERRTQGHCRETKRRSAVRENPHSVSRIPHPIAASSLCLPLLCALRS